jgi:GT2 family glycosyltransferase
MELLYVLYTYNRPAVLQECLRSLLFNSELQPDRVVIIDDGSERPLKESLASAVLSHGSPIDFFSFKENVGYGRAAEIGFAVADMFRPNYCFFIESDYIFRKHGLDEVIEVLRSDVGRFAAGVAGYSHPHFFDPRATNERYPQEMAVQHDRDNLNWAVLYRPFPYRSRFGEIQLQYVSNSCGTMYLNWRLISEMRQAF